MAPGSFTLAEELFLRGSPKFVEELRRVHDAERLGKFAARWLTDPRPEARRLLLDYLALPLNAYRHEALVKRLFKQAEQSGDDVVMGAFLVVLDRTVRRKRVQRTLHKWERCETRAMAEGFAKAWADDGYTVGQIFQQGRKFYVSGNKTVTVVATPSVPAMPRPPENRRNRAETIGDYYRTTYERKYLLFSPATRRYLRRRCWRYFRKLGKSSAARYRAAAVAYLRRYTDADVGSDLNLLDNWGLVHTLFHDSPALVRPAKGWDFAADKSLADLTPAPYLPAVWRDAPGELFGLLVDAGCRTVRQWAKSMLRAYHPGWLANQSILTVLKLLDHPDPDLSALGYDLLERHPGLSDVPVAEWLRRLDGDDLDRLQRLSSLLIRHLDPSRVALADAVKLAGYRSLPVARLGFSLARRRGTPAADEIPLLLTLVQAECPTIRQEIVAWLRETLVQSGHMSADWLLEFLDSKFQDVRAVGLEWLRASPLRDEPTLWHKLLESPYDDIRGPLADELTERARGADPDTVRLLWAGVLLNLYRGGRHKPGVVAHVVARITRHPDEADRLLPLLAIAVRSIRGPEFRVGLTGVITLLERQPALAASIGRQFPELVL